MKIRKLALLCLASIPVAIFLPFLACSQELETPPPGPPSSQMNYPMPPIAPPLVPEGVFSLQLVKALNLGQTDDEAEAETMLSALGIEPKNGWIAEYPLTPPIIAEIEKGVGGAADAGKLRMRKDEAMRALGELKNRLGFNIDSGRNPGLVEPQEKATNDVIYRYTDKGGVIHFVDRYEAIPKEYRNKLEVIRGAKHSPQPPSPLTQNPPPEAQWVPPALPVEGQMEPPMPPPELVDDYYSTEGPPVITYYPPPSDYSYLYSWSPYPFWWAGVYFPGFFILHDFHRHGFYHGHPFYVSNHFHHASGHRFSSVDPMTRSLTHSPVNSSRAFRTAGAQSSAQRILASVQNRAAAPSLNTARITAAAPSTTGPRAMNPVAGPGAMNMAAPRLNPGYGQMSPNRSVALPPPRTNLVGNYSQQAFNGRPLGSVAPRVSSSPPFRGNAGPSSFSGQHSFGGYHGGGGGGGHR